LSKTVEVRSSYSENINRNICSGDTLNFKGKLFYQEGNYAIMIPSTGGNCDSVFILNLSLDQPLLINDTIDFCSRDTVINGKIYSQEGSFTESVSNVRGCDSIIYTIKLQRVYADSVIELNEQYFCDTFKYRSLIITRPDKYLKLASDTAACIIYKINMNLIQDCQCIQFPNVFSPENGDDLNNEFKPYNPCGDTVVAYSLKVFNRWGMQLFATTDYLKGWDGRFKDEPAPVDSYIYISDYKIRYNSFESRPISKKGTVTLIR
jgi:gliding motility-associated-like protein